jgi:hypothetical protein
LAIEVDTSITGTRVKQVMNRLAEARGLPQSITVDNVLSSKASPTADEQYPGSRRQWHREAKTSSVSIKSSSLPQRSRSSLTIMNTRSV